MHGEDKENWYQFVIKSFKNQSIFIFAKDVDDLKKKKI